MIRIDGRHAGIELKTDKVTRVILDSKIRVSVGAGTALSVFFFNLIR
jgi:hypothetical protein